MSNAQDVPEGRPPEPGAPATITEPTPVDQALRASEGRFREMADQAPIMIGLTNRAGNITFLNKSWLDFRGWTSKEEVGWAWAESLHPEDRARVLAAIQSAVQRRVPYSLEYRITNHAGEYRWVLESASPLHDADGSPSGYVGTALDITDRKQADELLRRSERRFRALVEQGADAITLIGRDGTVLYEGPTVQRITGFAPEDRVGRNGLERVHPEDLAEVRTVFGRVLAQPGAAERACFRSIRKDGSVWWTEGTAANLLDEPSVQAIVVNYHDVTDQVRAETERRELERRLLHAQKLESLGVLAGGIAHDFNNLLMGILGSLDLVAHDPAATGVRAGIERAMQAARRAADLTRQMLAYSGKGRFVSVRVDLGELVRENAELLRATVRPQVSLDLSLSPEPAVIEADPGQVQQVVMNLITNASEAIGSSGGRITLRTGLLVCDDGCLARSRLEVKPASGRFAFVEVGDTGCGMDAMTQERLFDPFFTTKFTGRGLGMSAVLGIVRAHAGAILIDSAPGEGTRVRVLFPIPQSTAPRDASPRLSPPTERGGPPAGRLILVVDDEEVVRRPCREFVERLGYRGLEAAEGQTALALFAERPDEVALVILDLTMPGLSGAEVLRELRGRRPDLPVLVMSGFGEEAAREELGAESAVGFIQKPYRLAELKVKLAEILAHTRDAG